MNGGLNDEKNDVMGAQSGADIHDDPIAFSNSLG